jgi:hypothetical protein
MRTSRTVLRASGAVVAAVSVAVAALAGCDGTAVPRPVAPSANSVGQHAAIRQYADRVSGPIKDFRNAWQDYNDQGCLADASSNVCKRLPLTLKVAAFTLVAAFDGVIKPSGPAYLDPPPTEIAQLVARTRQAAAKVDGDLGGTRVPGWQSDALRLDVVLDGWRPYLGAG